MLPDILFHYFFIVLLYYFCIYLFNNYILVGLGWFELDPSCPVHSRSSLIKTADQHLMSKLYSKHYRITELGLRGSCMPSIWSRDHPLSSSLKHTHTHTPFFSQANHIVCLNPAWAFFHTLLPKYPVEHTRTADQIGRSSCRWEKRECRVRWREWGPRDCCLHQKDGQCICLKQTHLWTHLRTHNLMPSFFWSGCQLE